MFQYFHSEYGSAEGLVVSFCVKGAFPGHSLIYKHDNITKPGPCKHCLTHARLSSSLCINLGLLFLNKTWQCLKRAIQVSQRL